MVGLQAAVQFCFPNPFCGKPKLNDVRGFFIFNCFSQFYFLIIGI